QPVERAVRRLRGSGLAALRRSAARLGRRRTRTGGDGLDAAAPGSDLADGRSMITADHDRLASGPRGAEVYAERDPVLGSVTVTVLDPDADLDVILDWVRRPWARFWGLAELDRTALRDLYAYVDSLPSHHAFLIRIDGRPVVLLQTY